MGAPQKFGAKRRRVGSHFLRGLYTPQKTKAFVRIAIGVTFMAPMMVLAHFVVRTARGDYPWNGDSIGIPVFIYWLLVFPFSLLFLIQGLRSYKPEVFLFAWNPRRMWRSAAWTIMTIYPLGMSTVGMLLDGIYGRLYWVSFFFLLHLLLILIFRASIVMCEPGAQP